MNTKNHSDRAHAPLPPSASGRWLKCPPSQGYINALIKKGVIKKRVSGAAAERGTRIHELAESALRAALLDKPVRWKGEPDEVGEASAYVDHCMWLWDGAQMVDDDPLYGIESKSEVHPNCWGSCDFWIYSAGVLEVVDLKTGREPVDPRTSTQLVIYAAGIAMLLRKKKRTIKRVRLSVWQPNADPEEPARSHEMSIAEFVGVFEQVSAGIESASKWLKPKKDLEQYEVATEAGDHCGWCDALGVCKTAKSRALEISTQNFMPVPVDRVSLPDTTALEADQVGEILRRAPMFTAWLDAVRVRGLELAQKGKDIPGMKVVLKITRRAWEEGVTAKKIAKKVGLRESDVQEVRLLSPSKVEQKLKGDAKKRVNDLTFRPTGEPTIVPETDRRTALTGTKISFTPVSRGEEDDD